MDARRAVKAAKCAFERMKLARQRVDAAKVSLGERGPLWWSDGEPEYNRSLPRTGLSRMIRKITRLTQGFEPSDGLAGAARFSGPPCAGADTDEVARGSVAGSMRWLAAMAAIATIMAVAPIRIIRLFGRLLPLIPNLLSLCLLAGAASTSRRRLGRLRAGLSGF